MQSGTQDSIETLTPENFTTSAFIASYQNSYRQLLAEQDESIGLNTADKYILKQAAYTQIASEHLARKKDKSPVEARLTELDLIALYAICVDEQLVLQDDNPTEKFKTAEDMLRRNRAVAKEIETVNAGDSPIVIGLEAEGDNPYMPRPKVLTSTAVKPMERVLHESGIGTFKIEPYGANEYAISPAASIDTLGKELEIIMQARSSFMRQADILGMHENISGVEITKENTQMLALYAMQVAAKQIKPLVIYTIFDEEGKRHLSQKPVPDSVEKLREERRKNRLFATEGMWKFTQTPDGKFYKIPVHRMKYSGEKDVRIAPYPHKDQAAKSVLERRTNIILTAETYEDYMHELNTVYKAATCIASAQKPNNKKTTHDHKQSATWESAHISWVDLLAKYDLVQPDLAKCILGPYLTIKDLQIAMAEQPVDQFGAFINDLLLKIADEPDFANEANEILTKLCEGVD